MTIAISRLGYLAGVLFCVTASANATNKGNLENSLGHPPGVTYHTAAEAVNSKLYLPPPPRPGQPAFELDKAAYWDGYYIKGSQRWKQATRDADLNISNIAEIFSQPLGVTISAKTTPTLYAMLGNLLVDAKNYATDGAKKHYMRIRPFVYFGNHTCQSPSQEAHSRVSGSYPSGHTAYGWTLALVLAQIRPDRAEQIIQRGYEFGQSRVICGAHWQSDVNAGRIVGGVEYSRLQSIPAFRGALAKATEEVNYQQQRLQYHEVPLP